MLATALVVPFFFAVSATSGSDIKQQTSPPNSAITFLLIPDLPIWVSVTIQAPLRSASNAFSTACSEKHRESAYSKSALVWIARLMIGSCRGSKTRSPSSSVIISKLRFSISDGNTFSSSIFMPVPPPISDKSVPYPYSL